MDLSNLANYKNKILNVVLIIIALIIANNFYRGQMRNVASIREKKDMEIKKNAVLEDIAKKEKEMKAVKDAVNKKDISSVLDKIRDIARESSVNILSLKPQAEINFPNYVKYPFDLVIASDNYHNIGKFISRIENSPDIFIVEGLSIRAAAEQAEAQGRRAEIKLSTILIN